jgi:uncharacterized protein involved in response to NO
MHSDSRQVSRAAEPSGGDMPLFALGFRPFYLAAAAFAAGVVPLWVLVYSGGWHFPRADVFWHMHEMVFGFATAVLTGFLFTALPNWTGMTTPRGPALGLLVLLWLGGRIGALALSPLAFAAMDWPFLPIVAAIVLRLLLCSRNRRNLPVVALLVLLATANFTFHAAQLGWIGLSPVISMRAAIMLMLLFVTLIGGRVAPMFTRNGAPGSHPRQSPRLDLACVLALALGSVCWLSPVPPVVTAATLLIAAVANGVRLALWDPLATIRVPLLWTIHLSFALLVLGLILLATSALNMVSESSALHVLVVGAMTGMIGAMITRTALGHTGRQLQAGRAEITMYLLLRPVLLALAAVCWSLAFLVYLVRYTPFLSRPRADGRPG